MKLWKRRSATSRPKSGTRSARVAGLSYSRLAIRVTSRGHCQIMNILRIYYSPSIMHRYAVVQPLHIEELTFGAVACLGTFSATDGWRRSAFNYRGSSLPVVEIDSFYSNVSDWEVIL